MFCLMRSILEGKVNCLGENLTHKTTCKEGCSIKSLKEYLCGSLINLPTLKEKRNLRIQIIPKYFSKSVRITSYNMLSETERGKPIKPQVRLTNLSAATPDIILVLLLRRSRLHSGFHTFIRYTSKSFRMGGREIVRL